MKKRRDAVSMMTLGDMSLERDETERAENYYRRALGLDKNNGKAWYKLGEIYYGRGAIERAKYYYYTGVECGFDEARLPLSKIYYDEEKPEEAKEILTPLYMLNPMNDEVNLLMGHIELQAGNFSESMKYYYKASEIKNNSVRAHYSAGLAFYYNKDYNRAEAAFKKALNINPDYYPAKNALASCSTRKNLTDLSFSALVDTFPAENEGAKIPNIIPFTELDSNQERKTPQDEYPMISIIIPVSEWDIQLNECLNSCIDLKYEKFEVIVLPDKTHDHAPKGIKVISTGSVSFNDKLNIGVKESRGEMIVFLDGAFRPDSDWLKRGLELMNESSSPAVGGIGLADDDKPLLNKAALSIMENLYCGIDPFFKIKDSNGKRLACLFIKKSLLKQIFDYRSVKTSFDKIDLVKAVEDEYEIKIIGTEKIAVFYKPSPLFIPLLKDTANKARRDNADSQHEIRKNKHRILTVTILTMALFTAGIIGSMFINILVKPLLVLTALIAIATAGKTLLTFNPVLISIKAVGTALSYITYSVSSIYWSLKDRDTVKEIEIVESGERKKAETYQGEILSPTYSL
ncbi:MAG: tetratricopeptide repeat protein [FCB group bacterium]|nr:tetratricopeptide repeat protein [FCB group bacterium]